MKNIVKKVMAAIAISSLIIPSVNATVVDKYTITSPETILETDRMINGGTIQYSKPSSVYDFMDVFDNFNSVYVSENNVYWTTFDSEMNIEKTRVLPMLYDKSTTSPVLVDLTFDFGNAIYYANHLYVMYARQGTTSSSLGYSDTVMCLAKYNDNGDLVQSKEYVSSQLNPTPHWNLGTGDFEYGTYIPFYPNSNCSLAVNNNVLACFFGRQMYNSHSSSMLFFVDLDTLEYISNKYFADEDVVARYTEPASYYTSHSFGQRIVSTSDNGYVMAELGDAGINGATRGIMISKIYEEDRVLKLSKSRVIHVSEGADSSHGYNYTYSALGNVIELDDGYIYIGSMEKSLRLEYGKSINEPWNLFAQKYTKDFWKETSIKDMQVFDTPVRKVEGTKPATNYGRLYLTGNEEDYGIKWITDLDEGQLIPFVRAVKIDDNNIAILYEVLPYYYSDTINANTLKKTSFGDAYLMTVDKDANIVKEPEKLDGIHLNEEENYVYKDGKIYWTTSTGRDYNVTINVLDLYKENSQIDDPTTQVDADPIVIPENKNITSTGYYKGDLDRDGVVNANDAAVALKLYNYGGVTSDDLSIGDMDNDGIINANDAALILKIYNYGY